MNIIESENKKIEIIIRKKSEKYDIRDTEDVLNIVLR